MKFTCLQENLVRSLSVVGKAVSGKASLPVLSNVLLATDSGRLKLSATNLETAITTWIGAQVDAEGSVTVPSKVLYEFVANLPPSNIIGESDGTTLKLVCDTASSRFNGLSAGEFPDLPNKLEAVHLTMDPKVFSEAVMEAAFAAATDESRPVLTGVLLLVKGGSLFIVSVDGFRLAERVVKLEDSNVKKPFLAIVPSKMLMEVARLVGSYKEPLEVSLSKDENLVVFKVGDLLISSRTIDGDFPEYKKLIPDVKGVFTSVKLLTKDFSNALKLANVFAKEATSVIKLKFSPKEGALFVLSSSNEVGENSSRIETEVTGNEVEVGFNSRFILDALNNIKADEFTFEIPEKIGPGVPGVLRPSERSDHTYLVMPMQY